MPNVIKHKRSLTPGAVPTSIQLVEGELAVNAADGVLFTRTSADAVVGFPNLPFTANVGSFLIWDGTNWIASTPPEDGNFYARKDGAWVALAVDGGVVTPPAAVPAAPTGLAGYINAGLYWTAPEDDGGSAITGYKVYVTGNVDDEMYTDADVTSQGNFVIPATEGGDIQWQSVTVFGDGLVWKVSAVNALGEGPKSDPLTYDIV